MKQEDIESIIININYASSIYEELFELKKKLKRLKKELDKQTKETRALKFRAINTGQKAEIKRTFDQILNEISKENDIPREKLFIYFDKKICGGYFFKTDETKVETIKKQIGARGAFTFKFSLASNKEALKHAPLFCVYPLTKEEIARRKRVEGLRKADPFYGEYCFDAKPFSPMSDGTMLYRSLKREEGISAEMAWSFNVSEYGNMYYYVEPKYIDIDDGSILSKALKNLLTDDELREYYAQKREYKNLIEMRNQNIKKQEKTIKNLEQEIIKLNDEIPKKEKQTKHLGWPIIKIRLGDFIQEIYKSEETIINSKNSKLRFYGQKYYFDRNDVDIFHLGILMYGKEALKFDADFSWEMLYSDKMYDGKTLYQHSMKKFKKMKDITFYFNPIYFFKGMVPSIKNPNDILNECKIQKVVLKCIALEIARQEEKPKSYAEQIYEKYVKELSVQNTKKSHKKDISSDDSKSQEIKAGPILLQVSKEEALKQVKNDGLALRLLPDFKSDDEVVLEAVKQNGTAILFADNKYYSNAKIMLALARHKKCRYYFIRGINDILKTDIEFILAAYRIDPVLINVAASEEIKAQVRARDKFITLKKVIDNYLQDGSDTSKKVATLRKIR